MKEVIESIESSDNFKIGDETYCDNFEGFIVKTNLQEIKIGVSNDSSCCESWGRLTTNDNTDEFIGAEIVEIVLTDDCLNSKILDERMNYGLDDGDIQFVNINTNKGTLQLAVYNSHNGYYSHSIQIDSKQLKYKGSL